ncbi:furin-like protease 1, isoforms 1/1-X/2 isoform X4 [Oppia nitens]|uniref:furin-like protease 1, isoforms 1/1-X/2 isoform X4 n=1 Tax=Oppia nitens TaxID=1686743 RepID=UPI0023DBE6B0|nr:furin-like protease 1, isoforms 1/1-X/2 isoform X4 [Oppia nitens]
MALILSQMKTYLLRFSYIFYIIFSLIINALISDSKQIKCKSKTDCLLVFILAIICLNHHILGVTCDHQNNDNKMFTNEFAVSLKPDKCDDINAQTVANRYGYTLVGQIGSIDCHYLLRLNHISKRSTQYSHKDHSQLEKDSDVLWIQQQHIKRRVKRDFMYFDAKTAADNPLPDPFIVSTTTHSNSLDNETIRNSKDVEILKTRHKRDFVRLSANTRTSNVNIKRMQFDDPRWPQMWYLNRGQGLDMNVQMAWNKNITGRGAVVTILDDGLEKDHPDLISNYDPLASFDVNNHDEDPMPRYDMIDSNRHGTRCAGEVAANANNNICAVGIAYNAKVGGVRMLDGDVTDAVEARSLSLNPQHIDIYSASWGPDDDGKTVDGPGELATRAFMDGVNKGRKGLGSIFVWASGNGGREHDNCNCDGYTNSIWTLSISSATENGLVPWYSEACSSTLATTYSSGSFGERQIVTTDLHHGCTSSHTGTSASAPLAAGICALVLEANPKLTWRDMQHIVVQTAKPANLHARDWKINGVGRNVSHSFGYGLLDANAMVDLAKQWVTVPSQKLCEVRSQPIDKLVPAKSYIEMSLKVSCENVKYLEHTQAKVTLTATRRGDIHVYLTSPAGTRSTLLAQRPMDNSRSGFQNWPFMSVHSWGENPNGEWRLEIHNEGRYYISNGLQSIFGRAFLKEWTLVLYGTSVSPDRRQVKNKEWSGLRSKTYTPTVPLSTPSPVQDFANKVIVSEKSSPTKEPELILKEPNSNHIDDEDNSENIILSDSQTKNIYNRKEVKD